MDEKRQLQIDLHYLRLCREYALLSRCLSRRVGSLLVNPDGVVIGMGVNGPPRGTRHCSELPSCQQCHTTIRNLESTSCPYCSGSLVLGKSVSCPRRHPDGTSASIVECPAVHAEVNALLACGRTNNATVGCSLYIHPIGPCKDCAAQIVQAGIRKLIFPVSDWYDELGPKILSEGGIEVVNYPIDLMDKEEFL